jgi:serine protease inhibitor
MQARARRSAVFPLRVIGGQPSEVLYKRTAGWENYLISIDAQHRYNQFLLVDVRRVMKIRHAPLRSGCITALASAAFCLAAFTSPAASPGRERPADGKSQSQTVRSSRITSTHAFAFNLLGALAKEQPGGNVFISPYSISAALQIVCNGAEGETRKEMDGVLGRADIPAQDASMAFRRLSDSLKQASSNATLTVANAIWFSPHIELKQEFVSMSQTYYDAKVSALDFTDPRASGIVNRWVGENTRGKIDKIIEGPLSGMTGAFIANAIYFKGTWATRFDNKLTQSRSFHAGGDNSKLVPMMFQRDKFAYQETPGFQAARLPYAGNRLGMYLFLPATNSSASKLLESVSGPAWATLLSKFKSTEGQIGLPRFKLEFSAELNKSLNSLGMKKAFRPHTAEFSGISSTPLYIDLIKHKTFVEVNEEGTEAAGVTGITMRTTSVQIPEKPFEMILDRPFLFLIEDAPTREILFAGVMNDVP